MKYAESCAHFGHVAEVLSTFFHASSPPRTSSSVFFACSTRCFTPLVTSYAYGHDAHRSRTPPPLPERGDGDVVISARRRASSSVSRSSESTFPHVGQNVSMRGRRAADAAE